MVIDFQLLKQISILGIDSNQDISPLYMLLILFCLGFLLRYE